MFALFPHPSSAVLFVVVVDSESLTAPCIARILTCQVQEVIDELKLTKVADSFVGTAERRGLSGGERKRVSVGVGEAYVTCGSCRECVAVELLILTLRHACVDLNQSSSPTQVFSSWTSSRPDSTLRQPSR